MTERTFALCWPPMQAPPKADFPWWLAAAITIALAAAVFIAASDLYTQVFATVAKGIGITIFVTVVAFALASAIGLGIALMGLSGSLWLRQIARFYVEIIRGVPILVLLFWIAFAGAPAFVAAWNLLTAPLQKRRLSAANCRCAMCRCCGAPSSR